ncbi:hypothetical protein ACFQVD_26625 [Streptosporangium amethystogenes subsp. fukuiense]|uniref:Uncharacterized protein n=1 Tax=Streptosporangium amethystogenes subsp. fukuiense TaxID=698418 RepID=A0ABW2T5J4_9ACTN
MSAEEADERVTRFILKTYREEGYNDHLTTCPDLTAQNPEGYNSQYGCDTGCEYVRFEATMTCPHGESDDFEWGDFDDLASILKQLDEETL